MTKGILGRKVGMTQIFAENGELIPVTVVEAKGNVVLQKKTEEVEGYNAIQLGFDDKRPYDKERKDRLVKVANKPEQGHADKASTAPKRFVREIRDADVASYEVGQEVQVDIFAAGDLVDVTGVSKGKGFQGVIKRHGQARGPMAHGSRYHRRPGSMGACATPSRVLKGKKLPGHMGNVTATVQNLKVVKVDTEKNVILVKGSVPGPKGTIVKVKG